MTAEAEDECTCWHLPDPRGGTNPAAWLRLQEAVVVRITGLPGDPSELLEGRIWGAGWESKPSGSVRFILLEWEQGDALVIPEGRIEYVDIVGGSEPAVLARSLGLGSGFIASLGDQVGEHEASAAALFRHPGRGQVEVTIRRQTHRCIPNDSVVEQGTEDDTPDAVLLAQHP